MARFLGLPAVLSQFDLAPDVLQPFIRQAEAAFLRRERTQTQLLDELNRAAEQLVCSPFSRSAFNLHTQRLRAAARRSARLPVRGGEEKDPDIFSPAFHKRLTAAIGDVEVTFWEAALLSVVAPQDGAAALDPKGFSGFGGLYQAGNLATAFAGGMQSGSPFGGGLQGMMAGVKWHEGYQKSVLDAGGIPNPILDKVFPGLGLLAGPMIGRFETKRSAGR